ncbi:MAG: hypothetical protein R3F30_07590 [Planctomycetota bacterium]
MRRVTLAAIAVFLCVPVLPGQVTQARRLIGWTSSPLLPASGQLATQDVDACKPAQRACSGVLLNTTIPYAGATAFDPRHGSVWVCDDRTMEEWDPVSCQRLCSAQLHRMDQKASVSGFAIADARGMLYQLETRDGYAGILPWFVKDCPPTPTRGGCSLTLPARSVAAGLAYDEVRDLLYWTVSAPGVTGGYVNTLQVSSPGAACKPLATLALAGCGTPLNPFGMVTGLAYDTRDQRLYATDGRVTMIWRLDDPLKGVAKLLGCCDAGLSGGLFQGLAVAPAWARADYGSPCIGKGCPFCNQLGAGLVGGIPSLGNQAFGAIIERAPVPSFGVLLVGAGCIKGVQYPPFCGSFHVPLAPPSLALPVGVVTGKGQCLGSLVAPLPIPVDTGLQGQSICLQWIIVCGVASGFGMSQGIQLEVAGS